MHRTGAGSSLCTLSHHHPILPRQTRIRHAVREIRVPPAVRDLALPRTVVGRAHNIPLGGGLVIVEQRPEDAEAAQAAEAGVGAQRRDDSVVEVADVGAAGVEGEQVAVRVVRGAGVDGEREVRELQVGGEEGHDGGAPGVQAAVVRPRPVDHVGGRHLEVDAADQAEHGRGLGAQEGQRAGGGAGEDEAVVGEEDLAGLGGELVGDAEEGAGEDEARARGGEGGGEVRAAAEGVGAGAAAAAVVGLVVREVEAVLDDEAVVRPRVIAPADDEVGVFEDLLSELFGQFQEWETGRAADVVGRCEYHLLRQLPQRRIWHYSQTHGAALEVGETLEGLGDDPDVLPLEDIACESEVQFRGRAFCRDDIE